MSGASHDNIGYRAKRRRGVVEQGALSGVGAILQCAGHGSPLVGRSCHWDRLGSTSAMRPIADDGSIEQPGGGFLHQRTHTPDPEGPASLSQSSHSNQVPSRVGRSRLRVPPINGCTNLAIESPGTSDDG